MKKSDQEFIRELEKRAEAQKIILKTEILPFWARGLGEWLATNPWRVLMPIAGIVYFLLRLVWGRGLRELVLQIFGGF